MGRDEEGGTVSFTCCKLTAIVLAGGKSSRMGQDKALIAIQGVPLLQRVCGIAQSCADVVYVVTPWPDRYQHLLLPGCQFIREVPLSGESLAHGPLVGFAQGLAEVQTEWVLLLACDLPRLRVEVLQDWVTKLNSVRDDAIAALADHPKGWEPLCGFYRRRCLPQLLEFINQGGRSFQQWLRQYPVEVLPLAEPEMLFNCNTPEDLALS
ncbi:MAG: molybdenum cofactor guanylyltransferase [Nostoc sp.]|uniref:molybdenum cofactor guanylyltransferase n=1 Tax=Nostoc sp. TaxID=1180 RepID=UPI002FF6F161